MKFNKYIEYIIIILIVVIFSFFIYININKKIEPFEIPENIKTELYEQLEIKDMLTSDINNMKKYYGYDNIYNMKFLDTYNNKVNNIINNEKTSIKDNIKDKEDKLIFLKTEIEALANHLKLDLKNLDKQKFYNTIKSLNNGQELAIKKINNSYYIINVNNGCLTVNKNNIYGVTKCNPSNKDQHFYIDKVYDVNNYISKLNKNFNTLSVDNHKNVKYPFALIKSVNNDNCVKNIHGKLSIEPCREYVGQRWIPLERQNTCAN